MSYPVIQQCPVCQHSLHVTKLKCTHCQTTIENEFTLSKFASFSAEQMRFIEIFLICRGNIKEVEKELGISYPTVRGKLNEIIEQLGQNRQKGGSDRHTSDIISMLEKDELTSEEAIELLKKDVRR